MLLIGIPGNPVSSAAVFEFLIQPYLRALLGTGSAPALQARLQDAVVKPAELRCFHRGEWTLHPDGFLEARIFEGQDSHLVRVLARASAWVVLPEGPGRLEAGERVEVVPFFERRGEGLA
jgi:molybdopterin molybdotransferase